MRETQYCWNKSGRCVPSVSPRVFKRVIALFDWTPEGETKEFQGSVEECVVYCRTYFDNNPLDFLKKAPAFSSDEEYKKELKRWISATFSAVFWSYWSRQLILDGDTFIFNQLWGVRKVSSKKQDIEAVVPVAMRLIVKEISERDLLSLEHTELPYLVMKSDLDHVLETGRFCLAVDQRIVAIPVFVGAERLPLRAAPPAARILR